MTEKTLVLMRHGLKEDDYLSQRLAPEGVAQIFNLAGKLKAVVPSLDIIEASPVSRAVQTADIVAQSNYPETHVKTDSSLRMECDGANAIESLQESWNAVCFVSHEDTLKVISKSLCSSLAEGYSIPEGEAVVITFEDGPWPSSEPRPAKDITWLKADEGTSYEEAMAGLRAARAARVQKVTA